MAKDLIRVHYKVIDKEIWLFLLHTTLQDNIPGHQISRHFTQVRTLNFIST